MNNQNQQSSLEKPQKNLTRTKTWFLRTFVNYFNVNAHLNLYSWNKYLTEHSTLTFILHFEQTQNQKTIKQKEKVEGSTRHYNLSPPKSGTKNHSGTGHSDWMLRKAFRRTEIRIENGMRW